MEVSLGGRHLIPPPPPVIPFPPADRAIGDILSTWAHDDPDLLKALERIIRYVDGHRREWRAALLAFANVEQPH